MKRELKPEEHEQIVSAVATGDRRDQAGTNASAASRINCD
jgi:hypothetical protein